MNGNDASDIRETMELGMAACIALRDRALRAEAERDAALAEIAAAEKVSREELSAPHRFYSLRGEGPVPGAETAWREGWAEGYTAACTKLRAAAAPRVSGT